jgi:hypothetical protein
VVCFLGPWVFLLVLGLPDGFFELALGSPLYTSCVPRGALRFFS